MEDRTYALYVGGHKLALPWEAYTFWKASARIEVPIISQYDLGMLSWGNSLKKH